MPIPLSLQEGRDPLPPVAEELETKWGELEGATDALRAALQQRAEQHRKEAERAETDSLCRDNQEKAKVPTRVCSLSPTTASASPTSSPFLPAPRSSLSSPSPSPSPLS